jgi:hypothetical protein
MHVRPRSSRSNAEPLRLLTADAVWRSTDLVQVI